MKNTSLSRNFLHLLRASSRFSCRLHPHPFRRPGLGLMLPVLGLVAALALGGCAWNSCKTSSSVFQYSSIQALLEGGYDSDMTCGELARYGDFGTGTFEGLDGEMILLDGVNYQVKGDGTVQPATTEMKTPFATVMFFKGTELVAPRTSVDFPGLTSYLDLMLPTKNAIYAIRVDGTFKSVLTRSPQKQSKPYPRLVDALKNQPQFERQNVSGSIIGFRYPSFTNGVNVTGYHLHFISDDRTMGGHILGCRTDTIRIHLQEVNDLRMVLPQVQSIRDLDLSHEKKGELDKVEKLRVKPDSTGPKRD